MVVFVAFGLIIFNRFASGRFGCFFRSVLHGSVRFGSVLSCSAPFGSVRFGSVWFGSVLSGSAPFGSVRFDSVNVRFLSFRFGAIRCGAV